MSNANDMAFPDPLRAGESGLMNQAPYKEQQGMTKREYFAAKAMQGLLSNPNLKNAIDPLIKDSIEMADSLLQGLEKKECENPDQTIIEALEKILDKMEVSDASHHKTILMDEIQELKIKHW